MGAKHLYFIEVYSLRIEDGEKRPDVAIGRVRGISGTGAMNLMS